MKKEEYITWRKKSLLHGERRVYYMEKEEFT